MPNELIKKWEGFRTDPYLDVAGIPTIGYGTIKYPTGKKVTMADAPMSESFASMCLDDHLSKHVRPTILAKVKVPLNVNEKQAIESFIYNLGSTAFSRSTLLKKLNVDDFQGAADEFLKWTKARVNGKLKVVKGLKARRAEERLLFLAPAYKENPISKIIGEKIDVPVKDNIFVRFIKFLKGE